MFCEKGYLYVFSSEGCGGTHLRLIRLSKRELTTYMGKEIVNFLSFCLVPICSP